MIKTIWITILIALVLLSGCGVGETNTTKQKVTEPNTTQAVTTLSMSNSKSEKTKSSKITNTKAKKDKTSKNSSVRINEKALMKKYYFLSNDTESYLRKGAKINFKMDPYFCFNDSFNTFKFMPGWDGKLFLYYKKSKKVYKRNGERIEYRDYLNGVEIIKFISKKHRINIPEKINGKYVIKLGGFVTAFESDYDGDESDGLALINCLGYAENQKKIFIPSKVKEILWGMFEHGDLEKIEVSKDNKYYSSTNGILYSKNGKRKLCVPSRHPSGEDWILGN